MLQLGSDREVAAESTGIDTSDAQVSVMVEIGE